MQDWFINVFVTHLPPLPVTPYEPSLAPDRVVTQGPDPVQ